MKNLKDTGRAAFDRTRNSMVSGANVSVKDGAMNARRAFGAAAKAALPAAATVGVGGVATVKGIGALARGGKSNSPIPPVYNNIYR